MDLNNKLRQNKIAKKTYNYFKKALTSVSPTLNTKVTYFISKGKNLNLLEPQNFEEKLMWLKLNTYNNNPLVTLCADKYRVREYVIKCGYNGILNDLIRVWDSVDEMDWDSLPNKFALKCNHGSGYNIICDNKDGLNIDETKKKLDKWMKEDFWKFNAELNYKNISKKIICEEYLDTGQGFLPYDYKIYCFNGTPKAILVIGNRDQEAEAVFMSPNWEYLSNVAKYKKMNPLPKKPYSLGTMLEASTKLSNPFPFVRVDFYECNNKAIFGEMTFTPGACIHVSKTNIGGVSMGELLDIGGD